MFMAIATGGWKRILAGAGMVAALGLSLPALASSSLAEREFDDAVKTFTDGRRSEAFGRFIALANRGDVDAARIALFMHTYGPLLWGSHWEAGREDMEYWTTLLRNSSAASARAQPAFVPLAVAPAKNRLKTVSATKGKAVASAN